MWITVLLIVISMQVKNLKYISVISASIIILNAGNML